MDSDWDGSLDDIRALLDTCFIWDWVKFHGHPISNVLLLIYNRGWIHRSKCNNMSSYLVKENLNRFEWKARGWNHNLLWQYLSIALSKNSIFHGRSKHIEIKYHFIRELVENGNIKMEFCKFGQQLADIFTKPLGIGTFVHLRECLGVVDLDKK